MMVERKIPPLRKARYCCAELKEKRVPEQGKSILSFGVRKYESSRRNKTRDELEILRPGQKYADIMPFDNGENRKEFENCYRFNEKRLNPIAYWTNEDIWNYSDYWNLEQCELYKEGFERLGCIGCPMAGQCGREKEFARWPGFKKLYMRGFEKMIEARKAAGLRLFKNAETAEKWFDWWIQDRPAASESKIMENQMLLEFDDNYY